MFVYTPPAAADGAAPIACDAPRSASAPSVRGAIFSCHLGFSLFRCG